MPSWPLELLLGDFARELLLGGQRVVPAKAESAGFCFLARSIDEGLQAALRLDGVPAINPEQRAFQPDVNDKPSEDRRKIALAFPTVSDAS